MGDIDDSVPPLEDMSCLVDRIKDKQKSSQEVKVPSSDNKVTSQKSSQVKQKTSNTGYGGLRKGFLFGNKPKVKTINKPLEKETVKVDYEVKPKEKPDSNLIFNEVQENMVNDQKLFGGKEWITQDLLKNVEGNEKLLRQLNDPKFSKAVEMMQKDPKAAMQFYKNEADVQEFFQEFFKILGTHFTNFSDKADAISQAKGSPLKSEEEIQFEKTISNPEIQEVLSKPSIQNLFTILKNNPEEGQHMFRTADDDLKADVQKLVKAGLLSFESMPGKS